MLRREVAVASFNMSNERPIEVRRPAHKGLEAASRQTELGEKTQMSPSGPRPIYSEADRVISIFTFDPDLELCS